MEFKRNLSIVGNYLCPNTRIVGKYDVIVATGNNSIHTAIRAWGLWEEGKSDLLVLSGGVGQRTKTMVPEAISWVNSLYFAGIETRGIWLETRSTNTGENVRFTYQKLVENEITPRRVLVVTSPIALRRTSATFEFQWPKNDVEFVATTVVGGMGEVIKIANNPQHRYVDQMIGECDRLVEYGGKFISQQNLPDEVYEAVAVLKKMRSSREED